MSYSIEQVKEMFKNCPICGSIQIEGSNNLIARVINNKDSLLCVNCVPRFNYDYEKIYNDIMFKDDYIIDLTYCIAEYDKANLICNVNFNISYFKNKLVITMPGDKIVKQINSVIELRDLVYYYGSKFRKANLLL